MLYIESKNIINFTHTLSKLHRSALPNAIRFTLTDMAKDVKFNTLGKSAEKEFDVKNKQFFSVFSKYEPAKGWDISKMKSMAGMVKAQDQKKVASTKIAAQQTAGIVKDRSYIFAKEAMGVRGAKKWAVEFMQKKPIVTTKRGYWDNAEKALKENRPLLVKKRKRGFVVRVDRIAKRTVGFHDEDMKYPIKTTKVTSYETGRWVKLKKRRPFVNHAFIMTSKKGDQMFIKNAKIQIARLK